MKIYKHKGKSNISGVKIRQRRINARLSQEQLAAKLQLEGLIINQKQISRIETGDRVVADFELLFFARALGMSADCLLSES